MDRQMQFYNVITVIIVSLCNPTEYNQKRDGWPGDQIPVGGEIFHTRPWSQPSLLCNGYQVFPRGKAAGAWHLPPTPSSAKVKERVQLYLYSTSGPSWPVIGWTLPYIYYIVPHKLCLYEISRSHSSDLLGQVPTFAETCTLPWICRYSGPWNVDTHTPNYNILHPATEFNLNHACPSSFLTHTVDKTDN
jgi:hypothetical protein